MSFCILGRNGNTAESAYELDNGGLCFDCFSEISSSQTTETQRDNIASIVNDDLDMFLHSFSGLEFRKQMVAEKTLEISDLM